MDGHEKRSPDVVTLISVHLRLAKFDFFMQLVETYGKDFSSSTVSMCWNGVSNDWKHTTPSAKIKNSIPPARSLKVPVLASPPRSPRPKLSIEQKAVCSAAGFHFLRSVIHSFFCSCVSVSERTNLCYFHQRDRQRMLALL